MMCSDREVELNEYVDGTLAPQARALVETHLAQCAGCREAVAELRALVAGAAALPQSIEPGRDLWAPIHARIVRRATWNVQRRFWRGALAAAATLVIGFALSRLLPPSADFSRPGTETWAAAELDYARATDELTGALAAEDARLEPTTVVLLERNLGVIDAALRESREALARDPGNVDLRGLVASAAREKIELLRWATRVATSS